MPYTIYHINNPELCSTMCVDKYDVANCRLGTSRTSRPTEGQKRENKSKPHFSAITGINHVSRLRQLMRCRDVVPGTETDDDSLFIIGN